MQNRRSFIKNSGLLTLGALSANPLFEAFNGKKQQPIGLQLFTFFPNFDQDVKGNLQKIKAIGFEELESAFSMKGGFYGMTAKEFGAMTQDIGLMWRSHHVLGAPFKPRPGFDTSKMPKMQTLQSDAQEIVDTVAATGIKYLVCASTPIGTLDEVKASVDTLSKAGEMAKKAGLTLCYHNHDKEFKDVEGQKPYDVFLSQISPDLLKFELDLAWVSKAGVDPVELFKKNAGRFPLLHVKDFDKDFTNLMPVGEGVIDFKKIFQHAETGGVQHYFVEHDMPKDAAASIASSIAYLRKIM
jgi:sugar phosphate isomerase/epimerase